MFRRLEVVLAAAALASVLACAARAATPFPTKPIRIVIGSAPGGLLDVQTRIVAKEMGDRLGQAVVIENRPGAGSLIAIRAVKAAPADGYTLLATVNTIAIQQAVSIDPGYDIAKDFSGVAAISKSPFLLVKGPAQPDASLPALIARAKANPDLLTYASAGPGSTTHLAAALFTQMAGIKMKHVPYRGNPASWPDLVTGRVDILFEAYGAAAGMLRDGQLKASGVTSTTRMEAMPEVATIAEQGVKGYKFEFWIGLFAPAGTPKEIVQKLNEAVLAATNAPSVKERLRADGSEPMPMSPAAFDSFLADEVASMAKLIADADIPRQ